MKIIFPISIIALLSGCGLWSDFTTYFNTYYNAKSIFEEEESSILNTPKNLFEFKEALISTKSNQNLEKVIEKCSKIMQFETESSYFDKALFMTGKAFYYQQSYSKALRKFLELSALGETDLSLDSKLWIGKTQIQLRDFDAGITVLEDVKTEALKEEREEIYSEAFIKQISYLIYSENYSEAIAKINEFVEVIDSDELKAEVYYQLGRLYLIQNDPENAANAFMQVDQYDPSFDVEFYSRLEYARIKKQEGMLDESMQLFEEMRDEDKFRDSLGMVELEIADIYYIKGDTDQTLDLLTNIDSTYQKNESAGIARFRKAEIYEKDFVQYDSAMVYYGRVTSSIVSRELKEIAKEKYRVLDKYKLYHKNIHDLRRQISYIEFPELFVQDSVKYEEYQKRKQARADSIALANSDRLAQNRQLITNMTSETGDVPALNNLVTGQQGNQVPINNPLTVEEVIYPPPKPTVSIDSLHKMIAKEQYDLGNLFFTDLNVPDSALNYYEKVLSEYPNNRYYAKTIYSIGTYYLIKDDKVKADSLFQVVYDNYKNDTVYLEAAKQLGKIQRTSDSDPAYNLYLAAEEKYYNSEVDEAVKEFIGIYKNYSKSPLASQALFAAGFILENDKHDFDSAAVLYKSLLSEYQNTPYAKTIMAKLNIYEQEKSSSKQSSIPESVSSGTPTVSNKNSKTELSTPGKQDSVEIKRKQPLLPALQQKPETVQDTTVRIEE